MADGATVRVAFLTLVRDDFRELLVPQRNLMCREKNDDLRAFTLKCQWLSTEPST